MDLLTGSRNDFMIRSKTCVWFVIFMQLYILKFNNNGLIFFGTKIQIENDDLVLKKTRDILTYDAIGAIGMLNCSVVANIPKRMWPDLRNIHGRFMKISSKKMYFKYSWYTI